jgi:hypothetical protein
VLHAEQLPDAVQSLDAAPARHEAQLRALAQM